MLNNEYRFVTPTMMLPSTVLALAFLQQDSNHCCTWQPNRRVIYLQKPSASDQACSRRIVLASSAGVVPALALPSVARCEPRNVCITIEQRDRLGLQIYDVSIGTPSTNAVAIRVAERSAKNRKLQDGMLLRGFATAKDATKRISGGPFPVQLEFQNLAAQGNAISDLGTPMVSAKEALEMANSDSTSTANGAMYRQTIVKAPEKCDIQSRRLDVLQIRYEARMQGPTGILYDASDFRGTGRPYQMVLGSGDMLPGVDQGLYDMCPGEIRVLDIPPQLAYGAKGSKLFRIPSNIPLHWTVELVEIDGTRF